MIVIVHIQTYYYICIEFKFGIKNSELTITNANVSLLCEFYEFIRMCIINWERKTCHTVSGDANPN